MLGSKTFMFKICILRFMVQSVDADPKNLVFQIRISLNADPDPGFYINVDPDRDLDSGFWIPDPDPRSFCPKIKINGKVLEMLSFLALFSLFDF